MRFLIEPPKPLTFSPSPPTVSLTLSPKPAAFSLICSTMPCPLWAWAPFHCEVTQAGPTAGWPYMLVGSGTLVPFLRPAMRSLRMIEVCSLLSKIIQAMPDPIRAEDTG